MTGFRPQAPGLRPQASGTRPQGVDGAEFIVKAGELLE
jgi:hypothetical protein